MKRLILTSTLLMSASEACARGYHGYGHGDGLGGWLLIGFIVGLFYLRWIAHTVCMVVLGLVLQGLSKVLPGPMKRHPLMTAWAACSLAFAWAGHLDHGGVPVISVIWVAAAVVPPMLVLRAQGEV